jgi:hypothetical protein
VEEKAELKSRRRATKLKGREIGIIAIRITDLTKEISEKVKLKARRKAAREAIKIN